VVYMRQVMRRSGKTLLLLAMLASPLAAWAGHWVYQSDHTLRWHDDGRYVHLGSDDKGVVDVLGLTPAGLWGLDQGDTIVQADGHPVGSVSGLLATLRTHAASPLPLVVRHGGAERNVMLAVEANALVAAPVAPASAATTAAPSGPSRLVFQSDNSLRWRSEGRRVRLATSKDKAGVDVVAVVPDTLWGLAKGDEILAVNGEPTRSVAQLLERLRQPGEQPVSLTVRRGGTQQTVTLANEARELTASTHAAPPAASGE
ncbi:PDZ domain-containing protein, partial [Dyella sp. C11]|uniref:PDZ domain-containing protein n=1 Tax=Dyella sp. C11 TaxID=2126991 RepID=UPI0013004C7F